MRYPAIALLVLAAGCASRPQPRIVYEPPQPPPMIEPVSQVRFPEIVRAYHLGRQVDARQPGLMHEGHPIYRIEAHSSWNLKPGAPGEVHPLNPPPSAAYAPPATNDVILAELKRQKDATERVMWEAYQLARSYDELQSVLRDMRTVAKDHVTLKGLILHSDRRVTQLQEEMRKHMPPSPAATPEPPVEEAQPIPAPE